MALAPEIVNEIYYELLHSVSPEVLAYKNPDEFEKEIERYLKRYAKSNRLKMSIAELKKTALDLKNDFLGLGPLECLLNDEDVTEIMVNRHDHIFIEKNGRIQLSNVKFRDHQHVLNIVQRIANRINRRFDDSTPILNARLHDGSRVNAVLSPLSLDGISINIRKFKKGFLKLDNLIDVGTLTSPMAEFLKICAQCRVNILVAGGTGSGKTTLLNILASQANPDERIITIEDSAELQVNMDNLIRLESKDPNPEGRGAITIYDLVVNSLRMRPDRIIIGEVRGAEAFEMLKVLNTGHDGSMSTIHCNTAHESLLRLENMVAGSTSGIPFLTIRWQISAALDLVVFLKRFHDGSRKCSEILDIRGLKESAIETQHFVKFHIDGLDKDGKIIGHYKRYKTKPSFIEKIKTYGLEAEMNYCMKHWND